MRTTYLVLARILALLVVVQAMAIAFALAGLFHWITQEGGTLDETVIKSWDEAPPTFAGAIGHVIHAYFNGQMVIPLVAILLLIVSFLAKVPNGVAIAVVIVVLVALQILTGIYADYLPYLGLWHGVGALLIFAASIGAAMKAREAPAPAMRSTDAVASRLRLVAAYVGALAVLGPLAWLWQQSLMPTSYSVMDMGYVETGAGSHLGTHRHGDNLSVTDLREPATGKPDVRATLTARAEPITIVGHRMDGYTLNGSTPGPTITATEGDLIEVALNNKNVPDGATLHWHGLDVPNAEDGVAGVTQDAVLPGQSHTYRFRARQVGTYWYHSHQVSHEQVLGGLLGAIVIKPKAGIGQDRDVVAVAHTYRGNRTLNGKGTDQHVPAKPGETVRVRVVNTDTGTLATWVGGTARSRGTDRFRLLAIDGYDLSGPTPLHHQRLAIPAGGRADLEVTVPPSGSTRVQIGAATALVVGPSRTAVKPPQPSQAVDLLTYGDPVGRPPKPTRTFDYDIDRRPGFLDGKPGMWWTVNGHLFPHIPMYVVRKGDIVRFRIRNDSGVSHPMHLHGHHAQLLAVDGRPSRGSRVWMDSVDVAADQWVDIQFRADNPGIWMDHCHNLPHAAEGLVAHLMYEGVTTPYRIGGRSSNEPE